MQQATTSKYELKEVLLLILTKYWRRLVEPVGDKAPHEPLSTTTN